MGRRKLHFTAEEIREIAEALAEHDMNRRGAARMLHISISTMFHWLNAIEAQTGLNLRRFRDVQAAISDNSEGEEEAAG